MYQQSREAILCSHQNTEPLSVRDCQVLPQIIINVQEHTGMPLWAGHAVRVEQSLESFSVFL